MLSRNRTAKRWRSCASSLTSRFRDFDLFARIVDYKFQVNFHIDHKAASYDGSNMHSGEYGEDSALLNGEIERLKKTLAVAQLVERYIRIVEARGSILPRSTI